MCDAEKCDADEKKIMLQGEGGPGRSQFLNMLQSLVPEYGQCTFQPRERGGDYEAAKLADKILNFTLRY